MRKYEVVKPFWMGGHRYEAGDPIQLTDPAARNLARAGKIEAKAQPKKKDAPNQGASKK